ncbi:MAG TPA: outer membrane protein assembly factor BamA [Vicinamibacterales bacterium]|nr:outer membrane protein assembly factor BamA [Vicinamibacterales bacterium]
MISHVSSRLHRALVVALLLLTAACGADAQDVAAGSTLCGQPVAPPAQLPPADAGAVVYLMGVCLPAQGNVSAVEVETYLHYIQLRPSLPSQGKWVPYDEPAQETMRADFRRLWETNFLDDLRIEVDDYVFSNGVVGKMVTYVMEERERVKLVTYEGGRAVDRTRIEDALRDKKVELRLDSFLDGATLARVSRIVQDTLAEKGFPNATVRPVVKALAGGPKLVSVTFVIAEGPRMSIRDVAFIGNHAIDDARLLSALKWNRPEHLFSFATNRGRYDPNRFAEDAERVADYYRDLGYFQVRVDSPVVRPLDTSANGTTQWVQLRVPIEEGARYRVGTLSFEGNSVVQTAALRPLFKIESGDWYSQQRVRDAFEKARDLYGAGGYIEFTAFPDLRPRDASGTSTEAPVVDVTFRITEGDQYLVNRLSFTGNTTTRDGVIRRELQLFEGGVFNRQALKYSIQRINQLGYFKPLEGSDKDVAVEKVPGREHAVDVTVKVEEQNRNQMQFGAGMSQYEGVFGSLSYTTSNFLGRGESLTLSAQKGSRSSTYALGLTEPYVFSRPISAGASVFSRKIDYLTGANLVGYSEVRSGITLTVGKPLFRFARAFVGYGYEVIDTALSQSLLNDLDDNASVGVPVFNPFLDEGRHTESKMTPSFLYNTVNHPFQPRSGMKIALSAPVAGSVLGGSFNYIKPELETILYVPHTRKTALGLRFNGGLVQPFGGTHELPYYNRYFLGGETQIRGVDIRTVGPTDSQNRAIGGNRFVLFNAEYYFDLFGPVRALVFHDAGQAFSERQHVDLTRMRTSSGVELRVMVPMLNVPFRLIYAWNTYRDTFQKPRTFKFAVGTTF